MSDGSVKTVKAEQLSHRDYIPGTFRGPRVPHAYKQSVCAALSCDPSEEESRSHC